jgi:hypothetical protein
MKKTIIAGGLAAASLAVLIGGAAPAPAQQTPAATAAQTAPAARHARMEARRAQPVTQAEFIQARVSRLTALDTNHDGSVTPEEIRAAGQSRRAERASTRFEALDADKNGQISRAEFDAARPDRAAHRGQRGGEHRGQRMGRHAGGRHGGEGRGLGQRVSQHGPIVIADVQTKLTEGFARLDTDHDGVLSPTERQAGRAVMRERFEARRVNRQNRAPAATSASPSAPASE